MYSGITMKLFRLPEGFVEWRLDMPGSVNILNEQAIREWAEVMDILEEAEEIKGLVITSGKNSFIAGADVKSFPKTFSGSEESVKQWAGRSQNLCDRMEMLPFPSVAAIAKFALGGGLELALGADYRVITNGARLALPEVTLGLCPGWGGSVRLSRLIGLDAALTFIVKGEAILSDVAVSLCLADLSVAPSELLNESIALLKSKSRSKSLWEGRRELKRAPIQAVSLKHTEDSRHIQNSAFQAPNDIRRLVIENASVSFDKALQSERELFARLAKRHEARCLVGLFIAEQALNKRSARCAAEWPSVEVGGVVGAGVMGGGIAYQMATSGLRVVLKDIAQTALDLSIDTVEGYLSKQTTRGKMTTSEAEGALAKITQTLDYVHISQCQVVVEAVAENLKIKSAVLAELETGLAEDAILSSNTSTISINKLAEGLARPENFCGIHFFNPVPAMALVEIIRGNKTSDNTVARAVAFASAIGKSPIVVNDGAGFFVNRILFPYFNAFNLLLNEGVGFLRIDRVMEAFGWPLGPASLADVIGLDVLVHADNILQEAFPDRMRHHVSVIAEKLLNAGSRGKKSGSGFYDYSTDARGVTQKTTSITAEPYSCESSVAKNISDQEIVDRLMIPMCLEAMRCPRTGRGPCSRTGCP